jgi:hypothetical protein
MPPFRHSRGSRNPPWNAWIPAHLLAKAGTSWGNTPQRSESASEPVMEV